MLARMLGLVDELFRGLVVQHANDRRLHALGDVLPFHRFLGQLLRLEGNALGRFLSINAFTRSPGMTKPKLSFFPIVRLLARTMPTTTPNLLHSGPPLLPGLITQLIWIAPSSFSGSGTVLTKPAVNAGIALAVKLRTWPLSPYPSANPLSMPTPGINVHGGEGHAGGDLHVQHRHVALLVVGDDRGGTSLGLVGQADHEPLVAVNDVVVGDRVSAFGDAEPCANFGRYVAAMGHGVPQMVAFVLPRPSRSGWLVCTPGRRRFLSRPLCISAHGREVARPSNSTRRRRRARQRPRPLPLVELGDDGRGVPLTGRSLRHSKEPRLSLGLGDGAGGGYFCASPAAATPPTG